jgi:hypothetical protein
VNKAYFETRFRGTDTNLAWPREFVIISAYATTGEAWSPEQNEAADKALAAVVRERGVWLARIEGYSPSTGHAEPSWAAELPFEEACDLGRRFLQDAIFHVADNQLSVSRCNQVRELVRIGPFQERVDVGARPGNSLGRPAPSS